MPNIVTRFAPSPTGYLHLGHIYSALTAFSKAKEEGGRFILRIEDIDSTRCRKEFVEAIYEDLAWLGISWEEPVRIQSEHLDDYQKAIDVLEAKKLLYPCFCTRKDIALWDSGIGNNDDAVYPQICKNLSLDEIEDKKRRNIPYCLRFDTDRALDMISKQSKELYWFDLEKGKIAAKPENLGDVVLVRKDIAASYHLAVTIDDYLQGVNLVIRGDDLFQATHIHRLLQAVLELPTPNYWHHKLIVNQDGSKLSKSKHSLPIRELRSQGYSASEVISMAYK
ncbi:MAG: tRNA glutamyl-Q(34) synthetase GluQRS [Alphaproteobacteria bacterium]